MEDTITITLSRGDAETLNGILEEFYYLAKAIRDVNEVPTCENVQDAIWHLKCSIDRGLT